MSPQPWFPLNRFWRKDAPNVSTRSRQHEKFTAHRVRFLSVPRILKSLDGLLYFACVLPVLYRIRRRFAFDLIDAEFGYPDGFAALLLGIVFRRPVSLTFRGDEERIAKQGLRRLQLGTAVRHAARVITVSASLRDLALKLGADPARVRVIPNGVDADLFFRRDRVGARRELALPLNRPILLTVGGLIERKGQSRVLDILPRMLAEHPDLLYVAVGGNQPRDNHLRVIMSVVRKHRLEGHFRAVPPQLHCRIPLWMAAADVYCLATRAEGCCNSIAEALACGLPVVTTRVGGNPDLVRDGVDGFLIPYWDGPAFADAVLRALGRPWDAQAIAERARTRSWGEVAEEVVREFHAVLVDDPRGAGHSVTGPV